MPVRLFVGNLSYDATEAELREHFSAAGSPSYVYLPTDRESGRPRGFALSNSQIKRKPMRPYAALIINSSKAGRWRSTKLAHETVALVPEETPQRLRHGREGLLNRIALSGRRAAVVQAANSVQTRRLGGTASMRAAVRNRNAVLSERFVNGMVGNSLVGM